MPNGRSCNRRVTAKVGVLVVASLVASNASAEPRVPDDPRQILERVPAVGATSGLEPLRRRLRSNPRDLPTALRLAQGYLSIGRETSDPRFMSYAQATLAPWSGQANPPAAALVLSATALQSTHRFEEALTLLDRALTIEPANAQAWLTKATLLQVQGRLALARRACVHLLQTSDPLIALACVASVDSSSGKLDESYAKLRAALNLDRRAGGEVRAWASCMLGEMAVRQRNFAAAETHFKAALRLTPEDVYLKAAYADLLLLSGRNREVLVLLDGSEAHDVLLLRLAIASRRVNTDEAARWARLFEARRRAARPDDNTHLREHARFLLEVRDAPTQALELARKNWAVQREPADVRVYLQAARAAKQPGAAAIVQSWLRETGYEDRTLPDPLTRAARPRS